MDGKFKQLRAATPTGLIFIIEAEDYNDLLAKTIETARAELLLLESFSTADKPTRDRIKDTARLIGPSRLRSMAADRGAREFYDLGRYFNAVPDEPQPPVLHLPHAATPGARRSGSRGTAPSLDDMMG